MLRRYAQGTDVFNMPKIHFRSKSQHHKAELCGRDRCFQYAKDTLSKQITTISMIDLLIVEMFSICQRYTFEANHNRGRDLEYWTPDVFNMPKIHFRSKSQPRRCIHDFHLRCFQYAKDTLSKQITTGTPLDITIYKMFSICQRYTFEANHNCTRVCTNLKKDVFNMPKIHFRSKSQQ